jgi:hypothetical protein
VRVGPVMPTSTLCSCGAGAPAWCPTTGSPTTPAGCASRLPMPALATSLTELRRNYRQDLWVRSDVYVEVWCEKDALARVLMPVTREYDVPLMVARGFSSETFAQSAAETMVETGKPCYVYYVGDFDPSGWQIARTLEDDCAAALRMCDGTSKSPSHPRSRGD